MCIRDSRLHRGQLLRDLPEDQVPRLALGLLAIAKLLGLHQLPDESSLLALADFVRRRFPDFTEAELRHAVERWAAGELGHGLQTYGTLSVDFLGHLLHSYRTERTAHLRQAQLRQARELEEAAAGDPPPDDWHHRLVATYLTEHGQLPPIADWQACWRHLRTTGELPTLSPDELMEYSDRAQREVVAEQRAARLAGRRVPEAPAPAGDLWHAYLRQRRAQEYYRNLLNHVNP